MMNLPLFFGLAPWMACLAMALAMRDNVHGPVPLPHPLERPKAKSLWVGLPCLTGTGCFIFGCFQNAGIQWPLASLLFSIPLATKLVLHQLGHQKAHLTRVNQEMAWLIWRRGSIQDEIMRAREHEAMDRRLRRCRSTLLLSRGDAKDLQFLFGQLEKKLSLQPKNTDLAVLLIGGIAAHLRHVFMERDQDDLPLLEACQHIARWAEWLRTMGLDQLRVTGAPDTNHQSASKRVPSMLLLGAAEQMGIVALSESPVEHLEWQWVVHETSVSLTSSHGPIGPGSEHSAKDWDAAFMLRHGGIAHAGGAWNYELPLLPA
jgi:hypothetical protein